MKSFMALNIFTTQGVPKNLLESGAHIISFLDIFTRYAGCCVGTYLFIDFL